MNYIAITKTLWGCPVRASLLWSTPSSTWANFPESANRGDRLPLKVLTPNLIVGWDDGQRNPNIAYYVKPIANPSSTWVKIPESAKRGNRLPLKVLTPNSFVSWVERQRNPNIAII